MKDFKRSHPKFIYYLLNTVDFQSHSGKSGVPGVNRNDIHKELIACPPRKEQRTIATALSDMDALLEALDRPIAKKRDIKQATMQQLLTSQTRLPGFEGEWEVKLLGDVAHIKTGTRNNEDKVADGLSCGPQMWWSALIPIRTTVKLFSCPARVKSEASFTMLMGDSTKYVHLYMSHHFGSWAMQNTVKATVDSLRLPTFQGFELRLPPTLDEQVEIATILSDMDAEI